MEVVKAEHEKARKLISDNILKLHEIAKFLYEKETITGEEFMEVLDRPVEKLETVKPAAQVQDQENVQKDEQQDTAQ